MDKNRQILVNAVRNLRDYTPDDKIWEGLYSSLNKKSEAIKTVRLNLIDPPDSIWDKIDNTLTKREVHSGLRQFDPPVTVWENIDHNLSIRKKVHDRKRITQIMIWSSAAAAIFLLGFLIITSNKIDNKNFTYSEEIIAIQDLQKWIDEENVAEQTLELICIEKPTACSSAEFKTMEEDLAFLNQSKRAILQQLTKYSTNTDLEIMLTEIELERTSLIKEMIAKTM